MDLFFPIAYGDGGELEFDPAIRSSPAEAGTQFLIQSLALDSPLARE
jgi:hypothetical protein